MDYQSIPDLIVEIRALTTSKGWREQGADGDSTGPWFAAYCALAHSEISEALEAYRDKVWSDIREDGKPIGVGPELADTLIRILDMADIWHIDIVAETKRVLEFGWTRPYKHGGREL